MSVQMTLMGKILQPLKVLGHAVPEDQIKNIIDRLANVPTKFTASDLIVPGFMPGSDYQLKQEGLSRLCQRWRKLDLIVFKAERWELRKGAWDTMQTAALRAHAEREMQP